MRRGVFSGTHPFFNRYMAGCIRILKASVNEYYSMDSRRHEYRISQIS
ncbi:hypothetical protein SAMN04487964_102149 [Marinobacterium sediminicola]|uniref:Uncharacterized protein n=1 Tax=Marinobacterium sediminicola TaxID=518898 RepID=A0ABY1RXA5_9GAMM|nr:hypothetical protein SAMN04487964_102149 [Marinobacterium sediminicola]